MVDEVGRGLCHPATAAAAAHPAAPARKRDETIVAAVLAATATKAVGPDAATQKLPQLGDDEVGDRAVSMGLFGDEALEVRGDDAKQGRALGTAGRVRRGSTGCVHGHVGPGKQRPCRRRCRPRSGTCGIRRRGRRPAGGPASGGLVAPASPPRGFAGSCSGLIRSRRPAVVRVHVSVACVGASAIGLALPQIHRSCEFPRTGPRLENAGSPRLLEPRRSRGLPVECFGGFLQDGPDGGEGLGIAVLSLEQIVDIAEQAAGESSGFQGLAPHGDRAHRG